jgi:hypothetical protein
MAKFIKGDKVTWITKMMAVAHPEGKTDRDGVVLPVFRDTKRNGVIVSSNGSGGTFKVRPDNLRCGTPKGMDTYYDLNIKADELTKI